MHGTIEANGTDPAGRGRAPPAAEAAAAHESMLATGLLGTADIVFTVVAVSAPLAVVVALMPLALALGNGAGVPGTWLLATGAMFLFAIGYVRIIPHVRNAGAFYAYIAASIGKSWGLAAAYVAAMCYFSLGISTLSAFTVFCREFVRAATGIGIAWPYWGVAGSLLVGWLAYHRITVAAKVLGFALAAEVLLVLLLVAAIVVRRGPAAYDLADFSPHAIFAPGLGVALVYAFNSLIGIEGTAIYQEEARDAVVTVPKATFVSIGVIGLFYFVVGWSLTSAVGSSVVSQIARRDPEHFVTALAGDHLGTFGRLAFSTLILTSAIAAVLGLFNNTARYVYALARDGVLPAALARTHPRYSSPHVAGMVLMAAQIAIVLLSAQAGLDPLLNVSTALVGLGSVGLMALLGITSLAIPIYFVRHRTFGWRVTLAPTVGGVMIVIAACLAVSNYEVLTGVRSSVINRLPWMLPIVAAIGFFQATWLKVKYPQTYANIGKSQVEGGEAASGSATR